MFVRIQLPCDIYEMNKTNLLVAVKKKKVAVKSSDGCLVSPSTVPYPIIRYCLITDLPKAILLSNVIPCSAVLDQFITSIHLRN